MDKSTKIVHRIDELAMQGVFSNDQLVQIIELIGGYLNLMTISKYAKSHNLSYNGVKNNRKIIYLFGNKYVIDNN